MVTTDYQTWDNNISIALPSGFTLKDYRILRCIGQGGFGITYLAQHIPSGQKVVIKENMPAGFCHRSENTLRIAPSGSGEATDLYNWALNRFIDEAHTLSRLQHPHIVMVGETFTALGTAYYVMEHIDGEEIHNAAPSPQKIDEKWLSPVLHKLLGALDYVHNSGLMHRDIKPNNILLTRNSDPTLIDFGTARSLVSERSATMVESQGYSPLEQLQHRSQKGPWIDIYSLGATMHRLLTGQNPPRSLDRLTAPDPCMCLAQNTSLLKRFSKRFLSSIDKALDMNYKNRWQSAAQWMQELRAPIVFTGNEQPANYTIPAPTQLPAINRTVSTPQPTKNKKERKGTITDWWTFMLLIFISFILVVIFQSGFLFCALTLPLYLWAGIRRAKYFGMGTVKALTCTVGLPLVAYLIAGLFSEITGIDDGFTPPMIMVFIVVVLPGCIPSTKKV